MTGFDYFLITIWSLHTLSIIISFVGIMNDKRAMVALQMGQGSISFGAKGHLMWLIPAILAYRIWG